MHMSTIYSHLGLAMTLNTDSLWSVILRVLELDRMPDVLGDNIHTHTPTHTHIHTYTHIYIHINTHEHVHLICSFKTNHNKGAIQLPSVDFSDVKFEYRYITEFT